MLVYGIMGLTLITLGLMVHKLKWTFLISGYNTMSKEKKQRVDTEKLGRLLGWYTYINGGLFLVLGVFRGGSVSLPAAPGWIFFAISTLVVLVVAQKYDGNLFDSEGKLRKGQGKQILALLLGMVLVLGLVLGLLVSASRPTQVSFSAKGFEVHGMFGGEVLLDDAVTEIRLEDALPTLEMRMSGSAVGPHLRGRFRTTEYGSLRLFVRRDQPPFLYLKTGEGWIILNLETEADTRRFYDALLERIP